MKRLLVSTAFLMFALLSGCDGGGGGNAGSAGSAGNAGSAGSSAGSAGNAGSAGSDAGSAGNAGSAGSSAGSAGNAGSAGSGSGAFKWFTTCGDPACGMGTDDPNLADCTGEKEGDACSTEGQSCEIAGDDCNMNLLCATMDPKDKPGGCPKSLASVKHDISYLTDADRERIRADVVTMPLATWKYNHEPAVEKEHLGFIIDDQPPSSAAVRPSGERVDLYGYTSMAVAAIQAQDREIQALRRELSALREELRREKAGAAVCSP